MRVLAALACVSGLAACATGTTDPGRGLGQSDFALTQAERNAREVALTQPLVPSAASGTVPVNTPRPSGGITTAELSAAGIGPAPSALPAATSVPAPATVTAGDLPAPGGDIDRTAGVQASPSNAAPSGSAAISDEQNFDAVASRESIESDAARLAENAAAYQVVQPTALPQRTGDTGPNIVQYALSAPNLRGQEWYSRSIFTTQARFERNCASYRSPDEAQRDFLARGGPDRDSLGIDPDGDGFACGWDPAPFRAAVSGG